MTVKKNGEGLKEDKVAADGYSTVPDPVSGVQQNERPADKKEQDERPIGSERFKEATDALTSLMKTFPEFKSSDLASVFHAAVAKGPEANKRPADQSNIPENPKAKKGPTPVGEEFDTMFEGLDADLLLKTKTIFEAHLSSRVVAEIASLQEEYETKLQEAIKTEVEGLVENIDAYLNRVVEAWMEENRLAVEEGLRTEITNDFIQGLKKLFTEHYIDVPDEQLNVMKQYEEKLATLEAKLNEEIEKNIGLQKTLDEHKIEDIFDELTEGLAQTQVAKLKTLVEGIEYSNSDEYKTKVSILKESTFGKGKPATKPAVLNEDVENTDDEQKPQFQSPEIAAYVQSISRSIKK